MTEENRKLYLLALQEHLKELKENKTYAGKTLDSMIVLVATSGIFVLSNLLTGDGNYKFDEFKYAMVFFGVSILLNIISQVISEKCHSVLVDMYKDKIYDAQYEPKIDEAKYQRIEKRVRYWNLALFQLKYLSIVFLSVGIMWPIIGLITKL